MTDPFTNKAEELLTSLSAYHHADIPNKNTTLETLKTLQALTQLHHEEVERIIGDDELHTKYMKGYSSTTDIRELRNWSKVISDWRNKLRAEQRNRLNKGEQ